MNIKVGDTVRVVNAEGSWGTYQNGDTALVVKVGPGHARVSWITRNPASGAEGRPVELLMTSEIEVIKQDKAPNLSDWAKHYAISPAALEALTKLLEDGRTAV